MQVKVDQAEAYAALRAETWMMTGGFTLGLLAVGRLSGEQWGRLIYKHFDHHLRQFGV